MNDEKSIIKSFDVIDAVGLILKSGEDN